MNNTTPITGQWEDYADEHILFLRALNDVAPDSFEYIKVVRDPMDRHTCLFSHGAIYIDDYLTEPGLEHLKEILRGFDYRDIDDFVYQTQGSKDGWLYLENGEVDRVNSPGYIVDLCLLASLICESREDGIPMTEDEAADRTNLYLPADMHVKCIPGIGSAEPAKRAETVSDIFRIAEELDWNVTNETKYLHNPKFGEMSLRFQQESPAGEDFSFSVDGTSVEKLIHGIQEYASDFDEEEHAKEVMGMNGAPGLKALVDDAAEIQHMLDTLACAVSGTEI